jgi:Ca2+-transporting ATPase
MPINQFNLKGLTIDQVVHAREKYGLNVLHYKSENSFLATIKRIVKDPMVIMLLVAASIYFVSGKIGDGIFLTVAIVFQTSISVYQYSRSKNALEKLKYFSQPHCKVIRNEKVEEIKSSDLVIGDFLIVEEGNAISADGIIVHSNDFSANESILTGESFAVFKDKKREDNIIF